MGDYKNQPEQFQPGSAERNILDVVEAQLCFNSPFQVLDAIVEVLRRFEEVHLQPGNPQWAIQRGERAH